MGFSLSADRTQILVQNRSHYINPSSHAQFKKLGGWLDVHRKGLYAALDRDPLFAERYILYGEWLAATHSVLYTALPDLFAAFDMFDRAEGMFLGRTQLERVLEGTGITLVPVLRIGDMPDPGELEKMVQATSRFTEGKVEGVYVKVEDGGKVVARGKVVRGDFIAGNEHWTKGQLKWNIVLIQ
jgi:atypical dual specificity phosphatase